jgi:hypothetical protein
MLKYDTEKIIDSGDLDDLVIETYGKPYCFQQQNYCQSRGMVRINVPEEGDFDFKNDSIPEEVNGGKIGVSFKAWLERDPNAPLKGDKCTDKWHIDLFWKRNFYPNIQTIMNDLYAKGLIESGKYLINIDF